mmetsp:Transcript_7563/g.18543  ORF Transcript_7563/g.18543 Transcript_7563/m.18543 type:complete len:415 (-) Transcript_7563:191-1435(-)
MVRSAGGLWGTAVLVLSFALLVSVARAQGGSEREQGQGQSSTPCPSANQFLNDAGECQTQRGSPPSDQRGRNSSGMFTYLVAISVAAIVVFILRYFYLYRMNQRQLREMGHGGLLQRMMGGSEVELQRVNKPTHKQMLKEDLVRVTNGGESGTLWINVRTKNQTVEAEKMVPVFWKNVRQCDTDKLDLMAEFAKPLFGTHADEVSVPIIMSQSADDMVVDQSLPKKSMVVQELGEACCICLENKADTRNFPCGHATSCRQCLFQTLCTWARDFEPNCPLCRGTLAGVTLHSHISGPAGDGSGHPAEASAPAPPPPRPASERPIAYSLTQPPASGSSVGEQGQAARGGGGSGQAHPPLPEAGGASLAADLCFQSSAPASGTPQGGGGAAPPIVASVPLSTVQVASPTTHASHVAM